MILEHLLVEVLGRTKAGQFFHMLLLIFFVAALPVSVVFGLSLFTWNELARETQYHRRFGENWKSHYEADKAHCHRHAPKSQWPCWQQSSIVGLGCGFTGSSSPRYAVVKDILLTPQTAGVGEKDIKIGRLPAVRVSRGWSTQKKILNLLHHFLCSQIIRLESGSFGNAGQHFGANFIPIMKSEDEVRPTFPGENPMWRCRVAV